MTEIKKVKNEKGPLTSFSNKLLIFYHLSNLSHTVCLNFFPKMEIFHQWQRPKLSEKPAWVLCTLIIKFTKSYIYYKLHTWSKASWTYI